MDSDEHTKVNYPLFDEETDLAKRHPAQYSAQVDGDPWNYVEDGIRHIVVRDLSIEERYIIYEGNLVQLARGVF